MRVTSIMLNKGVPVIIDKDIVLELTDKGIEILKKQEGSK